MIKNIILDMGNVLLDYNPDICLDHFLQRQEDKAIIRRELFEGPEWTEGDLGYLSDAERFDGVSRRVPYKLHKALEKCVLEWHMCMTPISGAKTFCDRMKENGYHLYVLSNASKSFYDYFPRFAPFDYFDGIVVSCDIHMIKPDPSIYRHLLKKYRLNPAECFFIDDRKENIIAAKETGIDGTVFEGDYARIEKHLLSARADRVK